MQSTPHSRIITNHHWRPFKPAHEVPTEVLDDYSHLDIDELTWGWIQYQGQWLHISDFMRCEGSWDGVRGESYFSGLLIKVSQDSEEYKIARWLS